MMALIPVPSPDALQRPQSPVAGLPTAERVQLFPAPYGSEQSSQRWHAGEASAYTRTRLLTRGAIMPIGGEDALTPGSPILHAFFELAGGKQARIMLLPASGDPRDAESYRQLLTHRGATIDIGVVASTEDANAPALSARLTSMTGLFITGGAHEGFQRLLTGTRLAEAIRSANERGLVVAGCGAGAPLLGWRQLPAEPGGSMAPKNRPLEMALGLLDDVIIDRHATTPGRIEQLLTAFAARPNQIAFCLKQQSAIIVTPDRMARAIGERSVIVIDGRSSVSDLGDAVSGGVPTVTGARLHLLTPGRVFDLDRGRVVDLRRGPIGRPVG